MENDQEDFKVQLEDTEREIAGFSQHIKAEENASVAQFAETINEKLKAFNLKARKFNNQENLFERPITDYSKLQ